MSGLRTIAARIFPFFNQGEVVKGFGRGSKQLGIPTDRTMSSAPSQRNKLVAPLFMEGRVRRGFRRGGAQLAIPTANFPDSVVERLPKDLDCGIYFGWASVDDGPVHKMVVSVGWNPFYKNSKKTMETHILHQFKEDFYGSNLKVCVCGHLRPEKNFSSLDELIAAIKTDIQQAQELLDKPQYRVYREDNYFNVKANSHEL